MSRAHGVKGKALNWFVFLPHQKEFLSGAKKSFVAYGCGSEDSIVLLPAQVLLPLLPKLYTTEADGRICWHVQFSFKNGSVFLMPRSGEDPIEVTQYLLARKYAM